MSTFSAYGMGPKGFLVERPLNDYERAHLFNLKKPASDRVHHELSLVKLNSTYVECVDKWYAMRGFVAMAGFGFGGVICFGLSAVVDSSIRRGGVDVVLLFLVLGFLAMLWFAVRLFLSDAFAYTHYPVRFNRRNRQVYAFRRDGTVLKVKWDDLYWTMYGTGSKAADIFVAGHILKDDKRTVRETVALSMVTTAVQAGEQQLRDHFEFFRRYMEEGPGSVLNALKPIPLIMLPGIYKEKESWAFGWERLSLNINGFPLVQLLFQVFFLPISVFRWLVMHTSKIPQWPKWVEDECQVEPDDPWIRDERHAAK